MIKESAEIKRLQNLVANRDAEIARLNDEMNQLAEKVIRFEAMAIDTTKVNLDDCDELDAEIMRLARGIVERNKKTATEPAVLRRARGSR